LLINLRLILKLHDKPDQNSNIAAATWDYYSTDELMNRSRRNKPLLAIAPAMPIILLPEKSISLPINMLPSRQMSVLLASQYG